MRKYSKEISLGIFILAAGLLLAYMSITIGKFQFGDRLKVTAIFDSATGIVKDAPVMMAGIEIGHVESLEVKDGKAAMKLLIKPNIELHADAKAEIRAKSLLGEKYIMVTPGSASAPALKSGEEIKLTKTPVDLDEVLNHLAPVLTQLDPNDLNTFIHTIAVALKGKEEDIGDMISGAAVLMKAVHENKDAIGRSITNLDAVMIQANHLFSRNGRAIDNLIDNLSVVAASLRNDAPQLVKNINDLTSDMQQLTGPLSRNGEQLAQRLDRISRGAADLSDSLASHPELVPNLNNSLAQLPPLLRKAPATLDRLPVVLDELTPTLRQGGRLITRVEKSLDHLDPVLKKADELLDPNGVRKTVVEEGIKVNVDRVKLF